MGTQGQFALQISRFVDDAGQSADKVTREIVRSCYDRIVARSPVDTGEFKLSWGVAELGAEPVPGSAAITGGPMAGKVWRISTASPYAWKIEFGGYPSPPKHGSGRTIGGFSTQAPMGVVGLTALEFGSIVGEAARAAK
ncbi:hypothetical protein [Phenylobacterium sp.]|uniref:hypothetical protein n=1 Tax=Phenylobacterium sp. TaxID=1871053 RepID=UPI00374D37D6